MKVEQDRKPVRVLLTAAVLAGNDIIVCGHFAVCLSQ